MAFKEIFEDEKGGLSYMRVASMIALFNGIGTGWFGLVTGKSASEIIIAISIWVVAAFAPKAIQKFAEIRGTIPETKENETISDTDKPQDTGTAR